MIAYLQIIIHRVLSLFNPIENAWSCSVWIILIASLFRKTQRERWEDLVTIVGYIGYCGLAIQIQTLLVYLIPHTLDATFLRADHAMGFDPTRFANAFIPHGNVMVVLLSVYYVLPVAAAIAWVAEQSYAMRRSILIGGSACWILFALFPAMGPRSYSAHLLSSPRNCMPSMHLSWALLIALNARATCLRVFLWIFAALTALATIVTGEHYLIDLIAAVPYTLAVQWLATRHSLRFWAGVGQVPVQPAVSDSADIS